MSKEREGYRAFVTFGLFGCPPENANNISNGLSMKGRRWITMKVQSLGCPPRLCATANNGEG